MYTNRVDTCGKPIGEVDAGSDALCENCGGYGVISYNPNLNPNDFAGTATAKCTRCGGTGIEDTANVELSRLLQVGLSDLFGG